MNPVPHGLDDLAEASSGTNNEPRQSGGQDSHRNPSLERLESASNLNSQHSANWLTAKPINAYSHLWWALRLESKDQNQDCNQCVVTG